jgi:hypothetical protein
MLAEDPTLIGFEPWDGPCAVAEERRRRASINREQPSHYGIIANPGPANGRSFVATLKEYFLKDFANALSLDFDWEVAGTSKTTIPVKVGIETYSAAKFVVYYVPKHPDYLQVCAELIGAQLEATKKAIEIQTTIRFIADRTIGLIGSQHSVVSNRMYLYMEDEPAEDAISALDTLCKTKNLWVTLRTPAYAKQRMELERPLAFISHDSRDKAEIAGAIAIGLQKLLCPVWYDEYSLKVGDHLRESIERGLKETKKCILVLSPNFFANTGWTKVEFNSVFTREILEQTSVVLPVWCQVTRKEVYEYSPSLADRVGVNWNLGANEVVNRLYRAIMAG